MKTDEEFITALRQSQAAVDKVAQWLKTRGAYVSVPEVKVRPSFEDRFSYQDNGDILITQRIEVKHKQLDFTCRDDYPFATVFLDASYKIDSMGWGQLDSYVLMNRAKTHVAVVPSTSRGHWTKATVWDKKDRSHQSFYQCPVDLCTFYALES